MLEPDLIAHADLQQLIHNTILFVKSATALSFQHISASESAGGAAYQVLFAIAIVFTCVLLLEVPRDSTIARRIKHLFSSTVEPNIAPRLYAVKPGYETLLSVARVAHWLLRRTMWFTWTSICWTLRILKTVFHIVAYLYYVSFLLQLCLGVALWYSEGRVAFLERLRTVLGVSKPLLVKLLGSVASVKNPSDVA
ncbi:hypothetical protein SCHPADRAFT_905588 [Schizopora paradoxa]|uniref:Uncharacterized protein n=1 Tax=Schizopora paradoxa TaxID=27342 RepID=A0A0H2RIX5_9AGAM|nr:hypothetical protein SCHPADRAFT_905588 [Schizopora paradoxa]